MSDVIRGVVGETSPDATDRSPLPARGAPRLLWVNHFAVPPGAGGATRHHEVGRELVRRGWRVTIAASDLNFYTRQYSRRANPVAVGSDGMAQNVALPNRIPQTTSSRATVSHNPSAQTPVSRDAVAEEIDGVEFRWLYAAPYQGNNWRRVANWLSFARSLLREDAVSERPDIVIGSSPHLFAALAAERLAARWRVPFVLEVRDLWPESMLAAGAKKGMVYTALDKIARYLYRRAECIIVLARGSGRHLVERGIAAEKIAYIPNGVDTDAFANLYRPERDQFMVVYAGAHGPANGLEVVLDAAAQLRVYPHIKFVLVGDGPSKGALMEQAAAKGLTNVEFRGLIPKTAMPALLEEADAGFMVLKDSPLFAYGVSPNKLFDYLGAALPVICNVPGEVAEMLQASGAGEQAEPGSADSLVAAVLRMAGRGARDRAAMGACGRAWVAGEHGRPVLAERLDTVLRDVLSRVPR